MSIPRCGLCGSKEKLTVTKCCNHLICDDEEDEEDYDQFSFSLDSCHRNHNRYTLCAYHYKEQHKARDWRKCKECWDEFDPADAEYYATNNFNFKEKTGTECKECTKNIDVNTDDFVKRGGNYYCLECNSDKNKIAQGSESQKSNEQAEVRQVGRIKEESQASKLLRNASAQDNLQPEERKIEESQSEAPKREKKNPTNSNQNHIQGNIGNNAEQDIDNRASTSFRVSRINPVGQKTATKTVETQTIDQEMSTGKKYGKRKAQPEEDEEAKSSAKKRGGKKVKKNEDEPESGNKINIEIIFEKRATRSSSAKKQVEESSSKKKNKDDENDIGDRRRSSSAGKEKSKRKVKRKL